MEVKKRKVFFTETKWKNMNLDARSIAYYRRNPCIAAEDLLGVQLLDSQAYVLQSSWNCPNNVWACSRNWGKSFIIAIMAILKAILYENQNIYIISSVGAQAKETHGKIEEIVLRKGKTSESIASLKDIAEKETVKNASNAQNGGFKHSPESYEVSFYNGSSISTLNSKPDNIRGIFIFFNLIYKIKSIKEEIIMKNTVWSDNEIKFLYDNYHDMTNAQMASALNRSKTAVDLKLNRLGIKKSKYNYNIDYFHNIDSANKAYWLGFFYADGYTTIHRNQFGVNTYEAGIELQIKDKQHLKEFNKTINGNIEIKERIRKNPFDLSKDYHTAYIRLYNKTFVSNLISQGVVPNKSLVAQFPLNLGSYISDFIRGYYDGNGCVSCCKKKTHTISCNFTSGSQSFLLDLRSFLFQENIYSYLYQEKPNTYRLYIRGMENVDRFCSFIYKDASSYLSRKYEKACLLWREYYKWHKMPLHSEMGGFLNWRKNLEN